MTLATRIANVNQRILNAASQANRHSSDINLLAVSKTRDANTIRSAHEQGLFAFGENYLQEALEKQQLLTDCDIEWHFIGPIQSNKTRDIANSFSWVHSVDRIKIAKRLNDAATQTLNVCIQVNISEEDSKSGCKIDEIAAIANQIASMENLTLRGLMAIPSATDDTQIQRQMFNKLRQQFIELRKDHPNIDTLSMGMSADLEAAIAEGATIVRIGTDIFGPRNYRKAT